MGPFWFYRINLDLILNKFEIILEHFPSKTGGMFNLSVCVVQCPPQM